VKVYVTDEQSRGSPAAITPTATACQQVTGEVESEGLLRDNALNYGTASEMGDIDGIFQQTTSDEQTSDLNFEKVDIDVVISKSLEVAGRHQRVLVASCGPKSLMDDVVDSAHKWQNKRGLRIDVHCEDFDGC
jgi:hypothetical protein